MNQAVALAIQKSNIPQQKAISPLSPRQNNSRNMDLSLLKSYKHMWTVWANAHTHFSTLVRISRWFSFLFRNCSSWIQWLTAGLSSPALKSKEYTFTGKQRSVIPIQFKRKKLCLRLDLKIILTGSSARCSQQPLIVRLGPSNLSGVFPYIQLQHTAADPLIEVHAWKCC